MHRERQALNTKHARAWLASSTRKTMSSRGGGGGGREEGASEREGVRRYTPPARSCDVRGGAIGGLGRAVPLAAQDLIQFLRTFSASFIVADLAVILGRMLSLRCSGRISSSW